MKHIAYYISSHGFGHGVRASAICNCFSEPVSITLRTALPQKFFYEEITRGFAYEHGNFDCGCIQTDGITVDVEKTLRTYRTIAESNAATLDAELRWCSRQGITGILSDIAPFPFEIAFKAGIPSVAVSNFFWTDIYASYLIRGSWFEPIFESMEQQYSLANLICALSPSNQLRAAAGRRLAIPLVARTGTNRRDEIVRTYRLDPAKKIGLIYTGNFGMDRAAWSDLEKIDSWEFIGVYPLPGSPVNYHRVEKKDFRYQDLSASVDCMVSKIGYGVFTECLGNCVPLLYVPRRDFAEYPVLEQAVAEWGHGCCIAAGDFYALNWEPALTKLASQPRPPKVRADGASVCAREIEKFLNT